MVDEKLYKFIDKCEKIFEKTGLTEETDLMALDTSIEAKLEKLMDEKEKLLSLFSEEVGNIDTAKIYWVDMYKKSKYHFVIKYL